MRGPTRTASRLVALTGTSGAGKSQAIRALEDLGFFCVDNLPVELIPALAELALRAGAEFSRVAVVADVREGPRLAELPRTWRRLQRMKGLSPTLIFLDASDRALIRRFSETRRPHPLAARGSVVEGIAEERRRLAALRRLADRIIDTSDMTVHELRQAFLALATGATRLAGGGAGSGSLHRGGGYQGGAKRRRGQVVHQHFRGWEDRGWCEYRLVQTPKRAT